MSYSNDLFILLASYSRGYRLMRRYLYGHGSPIDLVDFTKKKGVRDHTLDITLYRLKKQGLLEKSHDIWRLTDKGKKVFNRLTQKEIYKNLSKRKKNMIITFDIPQSFRKKRFWLRHELSLLGFSPIQKSVWFGPAPLPKTFIKQLHELRLLPCLKFFKADQRTIV